jgi:UDP-N-acetylglucosamine 2-epimerase (hydrolysing)
MKLQNDYCKWGNEFSIYTIDHQILTSCFLIPPSLAVAKEYYQIGFEEFAIVMSNPVTTEERDMKVYVGNLIESLLNDTHNYVVIYPNNISGVNIL